MSGFQCLVLCVVFRDTNLHTRDLTVRLLPVLLEIRSGLSSPGGEQLDSPPCTSLLLVKPPRPALVI